MPNLNFDKTLFVCTGNVFRSIVAEKLFAQKVLKNETFFQVRSCGTDPFFKIPHPLLNRIVEKRYAITLYGHRARKITLEDIIWASSIICFTPEHKKAIIKMCPIAEKKTFLISDITPLNQALFQDVNYHDVSENNAVLLQGLSSLKAAVDYITGSPSLSIVMAVYNEERNIKNILSKLVAQSLDYSVKEIIVVSSGSTDRTDEIVKSIRSPLVTLIRENTRNGKVSALKKAVPLVQGDIVLLIDGDVDIDKNFVKECFSCMYGKIPCTGKVVPIQTSGRFFYGLSKVSCDAWNALRDKCDRAGEFLYPSGYTLLLTRQDFIDATSEMGDTTINDDGQLSHILYQKGITFHYSDNLKVYVTFPQSFKDFFKQKVRTRMGRRQIANTFFFKNIEKSWRKELVGAANIHNFHFVLSFLMMDAIARGIATIKIKFSQRPHLWSPVETTKNVQCFLYNKIVNKTET